MNFSVPSGNVPQTPPQNRPQTETSIQTQPPKTPPPPVPPLPSEEQRKQLFESQQQLDKPVDQTQGLAQGMLDGSQTQKITQNFNSVPQPQSLTLSLSQLQSRTAQDMPHLPLSPLDLSLVKMDDAGLKTAFTKYETAIQNFDVDSRQLLKDALREEMRPHLKALSKADKIYTLKGPSVNQVTQNAKAHFSNLTLNAGKNELLGELLTSHSKDELKAIMAELVGELREDKPRTLEQLSEKKQNLVNQLAAVIVRDRGYMHDLNNEAPSGIKAQAQAELTQAVHGVISQAGFSDLQLSQFKQLTENKLVELINPLYVSTATRPSQDPTRNALLESIRSYSEARTERTIPNFVKEIDASDLGTGVASTLAELSKHPGKKDFQAEVTNALRHHLQQLGPEHNTAWQLGLMSESQLKDLLQAAANSQAEGVLPLGKKELDRLVQEVRQLLPNHAGTAKFNFQHPDFPNGLEVPETIQIGAKTYVRADYLTKAGFGAVFAYVNQADPAEQVAVKMLLPGENNFALHAQTVNELNLHRELQGPDGHQNVIGLKGAVHGPGDSLCMVMEFASGGGLDKVADELKEAQNLTPQAKQLLSLAILKQTLESVDYMHTDRQMLHADLKLQNMMMGSDGKVKMIDFGTAYLGTERDEKRLVDNPLFLAPENCVTNIHSRSTSKSDTWSIGTMAYSLLVGEPDQHPFFAPKERMSENEKDIVAHGLNSQSRIMARAPGWTPTDANQPIQELVNGLMMPRPEQRFSARQALDLDLFQDPRLNSAEMQEILKQIATNPVKGVARLDAISQALNGLAS